MTQTVTETHKARKRHRCSWCWEHIEVGATYRRYRWFGHGDASTVRTHPECYQAILDEIASEGGEIEWTPGQERPQPINAAIAAGEGDK